MNNSKIGHTIKCQRLQVRRRLVQDRWRAKWPGHCTHCEANTASDDPCPFCLLILTCPRCGESNAMDAENATMPCIFCGYVEGHHAGIPPEHVCTCRVAKAAEAERQLQDAQRRLFQAEQRVARYTNPPIRAKRG